MATAIVGIILFILLGVSIYTVVGRRRKSGGAGCGCGSSGTSTPHKECNIHRN